MSPEEAVKAFKILNPNYTMGIHFGVFPISSVPYGEPEVKFGEALEQNKN